MNDEVTRTALRPPRLAAIDVLRGLVIVLMVLDHVRDFLHIDAASFDPLDPARTTAWLYATRWITHFCAPTFILLAGVSAWLQRARGRSERALSWFLLTRGLWLVLLECTVQGVGWSFSVPYLLFLQVIWVIGCSMIGLAACVWLPRSLVLVLGALMIAGHNLLDPIAAASWGRYEYLFEFLHAPGLWRHDGAPYALLVYPLIPWFGVMMLGYGLGPVFCAPPPQRDRLLLALGGALLATFLVLRLTNLYGDPHPWMAQASSARTVMDFLRVEKYPPSLLYLCATLGPVLLLVPWIERWRGAPARFFTVFGAVPLFAYVLHIYLGHALGIVLRWLTGQSLAGQFDELRVRVLHPEVLYGSGFSLGVVYFAWIGTVLALYPLCRWYGALRARRRDWWLSYL
jgi:uncharacterized membrane protein